MDGRYYKLHYDSNVMYRLAQEIVCPFGQLDRNSSVSYVFSLTRKDVENGQVEVPSSVMLKLPYQL
jgi:hypothetical protein